MTTTKYRPTNPETPNLFVLNENEEGKLNTYGFFVKSILSKRGLFIRTIFLVWLLINMLPIAAGLLFGFEFSIIPISILIFGIFGILIRETIYLIKTRSIFILQTKGGIVTSFVIYNLVYPKNGQEIINLLNKHIAPSISGNKTNEELYKEYIEESFRDIKTGAVMNIFRKTISLYFLFTVFNPIAFIAYFTIIGVFKLSWILIFLFPLFVGLLFLVLSPILLVLGVIFLKIIQDSPFINPISRYAQLGLELQNLSEQLQNQSDAIRNRVLQDMDFNTLRIEFNNLSNIFSRIIITTIKFERIEAKANKGNLFDSIKYINALHSDITAPLAMLKEFLERKRKNLLDSENELSQIKVGGNGESENIELQSKRNKTLLHELDTNITKLGQMMEKIK